MEVSELTLKLILLLIPGAIASILFEKLTIHKKWETFQFTAHSILFGAFSYLLAQCIWMIFDASDLSFVNFWANLPAKDISYTIIIKAIVASIITGFVAAAFDNYKIINRLGNAIEVTRKYGDQNLFTFFLDKKDVNEVYVHDLEKNITYHGSVLYFSETEELKELVLNDVKVYNYETAELAYKVDKIYLVRPKDKLDFEVPYIGVKSLENGPETTTPKTEK